MCEQCIPAAILAEMHQELSARRSGILHVEYHDGGVTKGKIEHVIVWERGPQGGRVERG